MTADRAYISPLLFTLQAPGCWAAPLLRAQADILRGAPTKAAKLLLSSLSSTLVAHPAGGDQQAVGSSSSSNLQGGSGESASGTSHSEPTSAAVSISRTDAAGTLPCTPVPTSTQTPPAGLQPCAQSPPSGSTSPLQAPQPSTCGALPPPALMRTSLFNDLGVAYHHLGRHHVSASFFAHTLAQLEQAAGAGGSQLEQAQQLQAAGPATPAPLQQPQAGSRCQSQSGPVAAGSQERAQAQGPGAAGSTQQYGVGSSTQARDAPPLVAGSWGPLPRAAVLYNAGVQHLLLGSWQLARKCLRGALAGPGTAASPLALLRLAEATLGEARASGRDAQDGQHSAAARMLPHHVLLPGGNGAGGPCVRSAQEGHIPVVRHFPACLGAGCAASRSGAGHAAMPLVGASGSGSKTSPHQGSLLQQEGDKQQQQQQQQQGAQHSASQQARELVTEAVAALTAALGLFDEQRAADRAAAAAAAAAEDEAAAWAAEVEVAAAVVGDPALGTGPPITSLTFHAAREGGAGGSSTTAGATAATAGTAGGTAGAANPLPSSPVKPFPPAQLCAGEEAAGLAAAPDVGLAAATSLGSRPGSVSMIMVAPAAGANTATGISGSTDASGSPSTSNDARLQAQLAGDVHAASESALQLSQLARGEAPAWAAHEASTLHAALLTNLAYAHLWLGEHDAALSAAKALLQLPDLSPASHMMGACYAAEAACVLGQTQEAQQLLSSCLAALQAHEAGASQQPCSPSQQAYSVQPGAPYAPAVSSPAGPGITAHDVSTGSPNTSTSTPVSLVVCSGDDGSARASGAAGTPSKGHPPHTTEPPPLQGLGNAAAIAAVTGGAARATLLSNLASVMAAEGQLEAARGLVARAVEADSDGSCRSARLLRVWVELAAGRQEAALALLRQS